MRLLLRLRARADAAYDNAYHDRLRGRIWKALRDTDFDRLHDADRPPGFCYSNIFPWGEISEGDRRTWLISSDDEEMLAAIARDFRRESDLNVGQMLFEVTDMEAVVTDVGEPGSRGVIQTGTGVICRIPPEKHDEYGIKPDEEYDADDPATYWEPDYSMDPFVTQITNNLDRKHDRYEPSDLPGPSETSTPLFSGYDLEKTYALPVQVARNTERTVIVSKWRFDYDVADDDHRRHLNMALRVGIGERNALGFGFLNITDGGTTEYVGGVGTDGAAPSRHGSGGSHA